MEVCGELRNRNIWTPVIMLTARSGELHRVAGLEIGADDYVTKPFSIRELVARARALLRRASPPTGAAERVRVGEAVIDFKQYAVFKKEKRYPLTPMELLLLKMFLDMLTKSSRGNGSSTRYRESMCSRRRARSIRFCCASATRSNRIPAGLCISSPCTAPATSLYRRSCKNNHNPLTSC